MGEEHMTLEDYRGLCDELTELRREVESLRTRIVGLEMDVRNMRRIRSATPANSPPAARGDPLSS